MTEADKVMLKEVAEAAAHKAVKDMLLQLGIDPDNPLEAQRDFQHLRDWRKAVDTIRTVGIKTLVGVLVTGLLGALWIGLKHKVGG